MFPDDESLDDPVKPVDRVKFGWEEFSRADFEMFRQAARRKWGVPDPLKTEALFQAGLFFADPMASRAAKAAAMRFVLAADKADLAEEVAAARNELQRLKLAAGETTDPAASCDPGAAAAALKAARETYDREHPAHPEGDPGHAAGDA